MLQQNEEIGSAAINISLPPKGHSASIPVDPISALKELQVKRRYCIKLQVKQENAVVALIARYCGYSSSADETTRAKLFRRAVKILAGWKKERVDLSDSEKKAGMLAADEIAMFYAVQEPLRKRRMAIEKEMRNLVRFLPGYDFAASVGGFGELGFAVIVAEAGDLAKYRHDRLWKRLGLTPYNGKAYSRWKSKELSAEEWIAGGYDPRRRAEIHSCVTEPLMRRQSVALKKPTNRDNGLYRAIYDARRAKCAVIHSDWSKTHSHMDGLRVMTKKLIRDLWRNWREDVRKLAAGQSRGFLNGAGY